MNLTQISAAAGFYGSVVVLLAFALPSFIGTIKRAGLIKAGLVIVLLAGLIVGFETLAVKTGLPYGKFNYGTAMGRKLFGTTPWIVALTYPPLVIGAYWLARKISSGFLTVIFTAVFTTSTYVVLAPALSKLGFWRWDNSGPFFGVNLISFAGWFGCAFIASVIASGLLSKSEPSRISAYSLLAILLFWSGVNIGISQLVPGLIGAGASLLLIILFAIEKRQEKQEERT